jgi:macrodomain Ter protein organizer (MatP/YcbG family)
MDTKLTIKLNEKVIEKAKEYAKQRGTSLSKLVENYFNTISNDSMVEEEITPLVKSLTGLIPHISEKDEKEAYTQYLIEKYK